MPFSFNNLILGNSLISSTGNYLYINGLSIVNNNNLPGDLVRTSGLNFLSGFYYFTTNPLNIYGSYIKIGGVGFTPATEIREDKILSDDRGGGLQECINLIDRQLISSELVGYPPRVSVDWQNQVLYSSFSEAVSLDWRNLRLVDINSVNALRWGNRSLLDTSATETINWGLKTMTSGWTTFAPTGVSGIVNKTYVDSNFLTTASAAALYLTISSAASTYLTNSNAASSYLSITNANNNFVNVVNPQTITGPKYVVTPVTGSGIANKDYVDGGDVLCNQKNFFNYAKPTGSWLMPLYGYGLLASTQVIDSANAYLAPFSSATGRVINSLAMNVTATGSHGGVVQFASYYAATNTGIGADRAIIAGAMIPNSSGNFSVTTIGEKVNTFGTPWTTPTGLFFTVFKYVPATNDYATVTFKSFENGGRDRFIFNALYGIRGVSASVTSDFQGGAVPSYGLSFSSHIGTNWTNNFINWLEGASNFGTIGVFIK